MTKFLAMLFLAIVIYPASAVEGVDTRGMLAGAKIAGACGILVQMNDFQQSTRMVGGDEFMERFWKTEAARLGKTMKEFGDLCRDAIKFYNDMYAGAGKKPN